MGTKFSNKRGKNLYDYWDDSLANNINEDLSDHNENVVVNCASVEYFKAIDRPSLEPQIITPQFKELKNGTYKMISFFAKKGAWDDGQVYSPESYRECKRYSCF